MNYNPIIRTKNFVRRNRKAIITVAGLTTIILLQDAGIRSTNKFLKDEGLFEKYYHMDEI